MNPADTSLAQRIVDAMPAIALLLDPAGRVEYINPFGEALIGYTLAELRGQDWFDCMLPDDEREQVCERFHAVMAGSPPERRSNALICRDGRRREIEWSAQRMLDDKGEALGFLATGQDVTERAAAEAALRERERVYRLQFESSPQPMWIYEPKTGRFLAANDAAVARYGYSREEFLAMSIADIHPPALVPELRADVLNARGLRMATKVWQHLRKDGSSMDVEISSHALAFEGRSARMVLAEDVTQRRQAEQTLRQSEELLRHFFESGLVGMAISSPRQQWQQVNQRLCEMLGYSAEQLTRLTWAELTHPGDLEADLAQFKRVLAGEIDGYRMDKRFIRADGSVLDAAIGVKRQMNGDGQPHRFYCIVEDISARKQVEQALMHHRDELEQEVMQRTFELVAARDEAERANRAKSAFLSRMSHELRTPLNAILGFSQLMAADSALKPKHQDFVGEMLRAGRHLLDLVNDVLDLASIESGRLTLSPEPLRLADLLGDCLRMIVPMAKAREVVIEVSGAENLVLRADRTRLRQVLLNLLSNAVKYNHKRGHVFIDAVALDADRVRLSVTDTGPGIPDDRLPRLFQPFERLGAEFGDIEGTGVGLTIARQLMEMMGGEIGVDGRPGQGARFWIVLPSARLAPAPGVPYATPASSGAAGLPAKWLTVLYVEDNPANLRLVEQIAARHQRLRLLSADAAQPGLALARSARPDLILLDIHLPDGDGYAVLAQLKASDATRHIPVVAVTAHAMPADLLRAQAAGFTACITKPVEIDRLDALFQSMRVMPDAG